MRDGLRKYLENFNKIIELDDDKRYGKYFGEDFFEKLSQDVLLKKKLCDENNDLINEYVVPLENEDKILDDEINEILEFLDVSDQNFESIDKGMLYRLNKILLKYYNQTNDLNSQIKAIYYCMFYEYSIQSALPRSSLNHNEYNLEYYIDNYDKLSTIGKSFLIRTYGNTTLFSDSNLKKAIDVLNFDISKKEKEPNLDIDYDKYISATERNVLYFRNYMKPGDEKYLDTIYEIAKKQLHNVTEILNSAFPVVASTKFIYYDVCYMKGEITSEELLKKIEDLTMPNDKMSIMEKFYVKIRLTATYIVYSQKFGCVDTNKLKLLINDSLELIRSIPSSQFSRSMNNDVLAFMSVIASFYSFDELFQVFYKFTSCRSIETLIHSESVASLCEILARHMIRKNPKFFLGILDNYEINDIKFNKGKITKAIYQMGILHDIGKYYCFPIISINYRKLEDIEFNMIKNHPTFGYKLVCDNFPQHICDGILYHHLWHNSKGGYPMGYKHTNNLPLIDILSICDSLDAATDFLGRPYAKIKKLDELIKEFDRQRDTRYSGEVINLLKDEDVFEDVSEFLYVKRKQIAYDAYHNSVNLSLDNMFKK